MENDEPVSIYESILRPAFFRLEPERAHDLAMRTLALGSGAPFLLKAVFGATPSRPCCVCGIQFRNPVGLAAGMDKNATALRAWDALGFGHVEVGTITARPQPGNPSPRMFRFPELGALINRMGFNNDGATAVAARLQRLKTDGAWPAIPVGINIGKSKVTPIDEAAADYCESFRRLLPFGDYFVVNVSSPNTPRLRSLQDADSLRQIIGDLRAIDAVKPVFVKVAPDLSDHQLGILAGLAEEAGFSGIVATNTTIDHSAIPPPKDEQGGLSGSPLQLRSRECLRILRNSTNLPLIASGGIMDAASAAERFTDGASLVQIYTGFVYRGPGLIREICKALPVFHG